MKAEKSYVGRRLIDMGYSLGEVNEMVPKIENLCMEYTLATGRDNLEELITAIGCKKESI